MTIAIVYAAPTAGKTEFIKRCVEQGIATLSPHNWDGSKKTCLFDTDDAWFAAPAASRWAMTRDFLSPKRGFDPALWQERSLIILSNMLPSTWLADADYFAFKPRFLGGYSPATPADFKARWDRRAKAKGVRNVNLLPPASKYEEWMPGIRLQSHILAGAALGFNWLAPGSHLSNDLRLFQLVKNF